jgi:chromate reductase, NAD(P)H dehydrogenase (quinone)
VKILAISGSLQAGSSNGAVLRVARSVAAAGTEVEIWDGLAAIPPFNPDDAGPPAPPPVEDLRARVAAAGGLLLATPEYAHGMPGVLKNALDWLVGTGELYGKRVAVLTGSPRPDGGAHARRWTEQTLGAQGAVVVSSGAVFVRRGEPVDAAAARPDAAAAIAAALAALAAPEVSGGS